MEKPLSGIKVLDLTTFVAAPVCCRLMADMGADVIKVERPDGDTWRVTGKGYNPSRFSDEENPVFDIYNSGKRHIALNLKDPDGMAVFKKLLAQADVFITNTRPAALHRLGIAYEDLKEDYPSLIYGIVEGYGEKGPAKDDPAFDTTAFWSRSGFLRDMAPDGEHYAPVLPPFGVGDTVTGYLLLSQVLAALLRRANTGKGDFVCSSLYHNGIFTMGTMQIITQEPWGRSYPTTRIAYGVPGGTYRCGDGEYIFVSIGYAEKKLLPLLYKMIGREDLLSHPKFCDGPTGRKHAEEYYAIFREAFLTMPSTHWLKLAREYDMPIVPMNHFKDVTKDPQAWENDYLEYMHYPNGNVDIMPRSPIEMASMGPIATKAAPGIGAHTDEVLTALGYPAEEIERMKSTGAIK
ncbi:MAG: CoA transferase [Oscillospiraceae bacterium]|nr:CoA transferase [Oscillospiraceae bacterium]